MQSHDAVNACNTWLEIVHIDLKSAKTLLNAELFSTALYHS